MSWRESLRPPARAILALSLGAAALLPAAAQAAIVIASSGPSAGSYPPGTKLPDDARITLRQADSVTVLDRNGTRVLKGAGTYTVGSTLGINKVSTFAALTLQRNATRVRTGAVRGEGPDGRPLRPNLWYVDVTAPGTVCLTSLSDVRAWRPGKDGAARYGIARSSGGGAGSIAFADQSMVAPWDSARAPLSDGAAYAIKANGAAEAVTVTFALVPATDAKGAPLDMEALGAALLARGCSGQLAVMTQTLALPPG